MSTPRIQNTLAQPKSVTKARLIILCLVANAFVLTLAAEKATANPKRQVTIAVVLDGNWASLSAVHKAIQKQVTELAGSKYTIGFPDALQIDGKFSPKQISLALDRLLADPSVDLIYALGPLASSLVGKRSSLTKPVIAPFIIDRKLQQLPFRKGTSGRKNLNYLDWPWSVKRDLEVFHQVAGAKEIVLLTSEYLSKAMPELSDRASVIAKQLGMKMSAIPVTETIEPVLAAIPKSTTGVYYAPLVQLPPKQLDRLLMELRTRRIATFSMQGEQDVRRGALAARRPNGSIGRIARRVALHTQRILAGQDPASLSVALKLPERVIINLATARAIGLSPAWDILTDAEVVDVERSTGVRKITLLGAMSEALKGNVNIKALEQVVAAGRANVRKARSNLLPRLNLSSDARVIDRDRARAGFGNAPQYLWTGDLGVSQLLFSEKAWAGLKAEKHAQRARKNQLTQTKWDVIAEVGVAYMTVLRSKTNERIQRDNLKLTRSNLDLARVRFDAGSGSKSDIYRWEAQIANDRKAVIQAAAQRNIAEIDLQRILHRPAEEPILTEESELGATGILDRQKGIYQFIRDPWTFRIFRQFVVQESIDRSPEIKQLNAQIAAQQRLVKSAKWARFAPELGVSAGATQRLWKGGVGSDVQGTTTTDSLEWFVGLNLSLPLYSGGSRYAEIDRSRAELSRLHHEREAVRDQITQRAASQLHLLGASYAGISLSRQAAEAAKKNYQLIATSYAEGAVRIVDLLDAQNAWIQSDQVAADSIYDFVIDWINVQRAVGWFQLLMSKEDQREFVQRVHAYIAAQKPDAATK